MTNIDKDKVTTKEEVISYVADQFAEIFMTDAWTDLIEDYLCMLPDCPDLTRDDDRLGDDLMKFEETKVHGMFLDFVGEIRKRWIAVHLEMRANAERDAEQLRRREHYENLARQVEEKTKHNAEVIRTGSGLMWEDGGGQTDDDDIEGG